MNPMTPQPAVAATLTRWGHPILKPTEKLSWATKGEQGKNYQITFGAPELGF